MALLQRVLLAGCLPKSLTLEEAIESSLKQVVEEKLDATNTELATVQPGLNFHMFTKEELEEMIKEI